MKTIEEFYLKNNDKFLRLIQQLPQKKRELHKKNWASIGSSYSTSLESKLVYIRTVINELRREKNKIPYSRFDIMDLSDD